MDNFFTQIWRLSLRPNDGKTRWGDKSPQSERFWQDVYQHHPNARFVWVVRDPRAVCASNRRRFGGKIATSAAGWCSSVASWLRVTTAIPLEQLYCVRYEEFVEYPAGASDQLLDFVGGRTNNLQLGTAFPKNVPSGSHHDKHRIDHPNCC